MTINTNKKSLWNYIRKKIQFRGQYCSTTNQVFHYNKLQIYSQTFFSFTCVNNPTTTPNHLFKPSQSNININYNYTISKPEIFDILSNINTTI